MRVAKRKLNESLEVEAVKVIFGKLKDIRSAGETEKFLNTFFTARERDGILRRVAATILLAKGEKYRDIEDRLDISKGTISKAKDIMSGRGYGRNPGRRKQKERVEIVSSWPKKKKRIFPKKYKGAKGILDLIS